MIIHGSAPHHQVGARVQHISPAARGQPQLAAIGGQGGNAVGGRRRPGDHQLAGPVLGDAAGGSNHGGPGDGLVARAGNGQRIGPGVQARAPDGQGAAGSHRPRLRRAQGQTAIKGCVVIGRGQVEARGVQGQSIAASIGHRQRPERIIIKLQAAQGHGPSQGHGSHVGGGRGVAEFADRGDRRGGAAPVGGGTHRRGVTFQDVAGLGGQSIGRQKQTGQ